MANEDYVDIVEVLEIHSHDKHEWYYRGKSANGEVLFTSEGYSDKETAEHYGDKIALAHGATLRVIE